MTARPRTSGHTHCQAWNCNSGYYNHHEGEKKSLFNFPNLRTSKEKNNIIIFKKKNSNPNIWNDYFEYLNNVLRLNEVPFRNNKVTVHKYELVIRKNEELICKYEKENPAFWIYEMTTWIYK